MMVPFVLIVAHQNTNKGISSGQGGKASWDQVCCWTSASAYVSQYLFVLSVRLIAAVCT